MSERTIRVGIDDAPPVPIQLGNPATGDFRGYEVDLLQEIGQRAGFRFSFRRALWSVIVHELVTVQVDLVCSAATITRERQRQVDFCSPHLDVALAVVKRDGIDPDTSITGLRLGVRRGTTAESHIRKKALELSQISESNEELYALLAAGKLDAVIDDSPIAKWFSRSVSGLQFAGTLHGTEATYGIMVRKGNDELRTELNSVLEQITNDGTLRSLVRKWLG